MNENPAIRWMFYVLGWGLLIGVLMLLGLTAAGPLPTIVSATVGYGCGLAVIILALRSWARWLGRSQE